jgi:hypothetical protein
MRVCSKSWFFICIFACFFFFVFSQHLLKVLGNCSAASAVAAQFALVFVQHFEFLANFIKRSQSGLY